MTLRRREFVSLSALALAGCLGNGGSAEGSSTSFDDHPSTRGIETAAVLGDEDSEKRIVAFEDPSCPTCARFSRETLPLLEEDAENGELAFYLRAVPFIRPWSETATPALYATGERDADAFWTLLESYYGNQASLSTDNVDEMTRDFLADTSVDADDVLAKADNGTQDSTVQTAVGAARDAGIGATPTFYLFDEDGFVTDTSGARDYNVFATSLGL